MDNYLNGWKNKENERYPVYADFFAETVKERDEEEKEKREKKREKTKDKKKEKTKGKKEKEENEYEYDEDDEIQITPSEEDNGENEYATLRAKNSTIFSDYFGGCSTSRSSKEKKKKNGKDGRKDKKNGSDIGSESGKEKKGSPTNDDVEEIPFPTSKNYVLKLFEGDIVHKKHKIRLTKPGFYGIFLENHNSSKWDAFYFGLVKVQVQLYYKLHMRNKHVEEIEKRKIETDLNESVDLEDYLDELKRRRARKLKARKDKKKKEEHIQKEINEACKFNLEHNGLEYKSDEKKEKHFKFSSSKSDEELNETDDFDATEDMEDEELKKYVQNKLKAKNTNYYDNLEIKTKYKSIPFESDEGVGEQYTCSFKLENCLRVSAQKNRFAYLYNEDPNTILEIDVSAYMALGMSVSCKYGVLYCGKYHPMPRSPNAAFTRPVSILSLDGGGVLSISSLQILSRLEVEIRKQLGNDDVNLIDCFDMIAGTSAGGLISLGLLREMSVQDMVKIWPATIKQIFYGRRTFISGLLFGGYNVNRAKRILRENMGNKFMSSFKKTYCFVATTDVKHNPFRLFLLRNYNHKHKPSTGEPHAGVNKVPLWVAGWATSAAPTYIKGASGDDIRQMGLKIKPEVHLVDGALKANNPTLVALEECARLSNKCLATFIKEDLDTVVSVGTGQSPTKLTQADPKQSSASTIDIIMSSTHLLTRANQIHREVLQWLGERENVYFRLNTPNIGDIELDSQKPTDLDLIVKATHEYLFDEKYFDIKRLAAKLANNYITSRYM